MQTGFDPRALTTPYRYFRITPVRIQAWREANELDGREVMRGGEWLAAPTASSGTSVATG